MSYQPYPGGAQSQPPETSSSPPAIPQSVTRAVQLMYVGAAASLIGIVITILDRHAIRNALATRNTAHRLTTSQLNTDYHAVLGASIVIGLIGVGLWLWMAYSCKAGKGWARIVSSVLFGLDTLGLLAGAVTSAGAARIYSIVVWLIGLGAIIFLWQRSSTEYFKSSAAPRY
jgi:hypothetical protein